MLGAGDKIYKNTRSRRSTQWNSRGNNYVGSEITRKKRIYNDILILATSESHFHRCMNTKYSILSDMQHY